jgi:hypothetical protein
MPLLVLAGVLVALSGFPADPHLGAEPAGDSEGSPAA